MSKNLQSIGITPRTPEVVEETETDTGPSYPIEVRPGVFYDQSTADAMGFEQTPTNGILDVFGKFISGKMKTPPSEAFIMPETPDYYKDIPVISAPLQALGEKLEDRFPNQTQTVTQDQYRGLQENQQKNMDDARRDRLLPQAQEFGVSIVPGYDSTLISDLVAEKSTAINPIDGQQLLYLADTPEQYKNALGEIFGADNVRMIEDKGKNYNFFAPKYYASVKTDDGWTDFAPATVGTADFISRYAPGLGAETAAYLPIVPLAMKVGAVVSVATGPAAIIFGPLAVGYTLFAGAKGVTAARQWLQDTYGLNGEQADSMQGWFETLTNATKEVVFPEWLQDAMDDIYIAESIFTPTDNEPGSTKQEKEQQMAGYFDAVTGTVPGLRSMVRIAKSRLFESGAVEKVTKYVQSGVETQAAAKQTMGKGIDGTDDPLFLGTDNALNSLILPQVVKSKVIDRLTSLVSQNAVKLDETLRAQMQSVVRYAGAAKDKLGSGDVKAFLSNIENIGARLNSYKNAAPPEVAAMDKSLFKIGESLDSLDEMFLAIRGMASEKQYANVFDKLKNADYDLTGIRERLSSNLRTIIPTTDAASKRGARMEPGQMSPVKGEMQFDGLIDEIMSLGTQPGSELRLLNKGQVKTAIERFQKDHPEFNFDPTDITSPAELLHMYAKRFGDLAVNTFGTGAPGENKGRYAQAIGMKDALLDLIGSPRNIDEEAAKAIRQELSDANAYSKETFKLTSTRVQNETRNVRRSSETPEPGQLAKDITYPRAETTQTVLNIAEQSRQVKLFLEEPKNVRELNEYLVRKSKSLNVDSAAPPAIKAFDDVQAYVKSRVDDALNRTATADTSVQKPVTALDDVLAEFPDQTVRDALGLTDDVVAQLRVDASLLAKFRDSDVIQGVRGLAPDSSFNDVFTQINWDSRAEIRKGLNELGMPARRAATPEAQAEAKENLRQGLFNYMLSPESGIFTKSAKSGVIEDYGDDIIDGAKLQKLIEDVKASGGKDILSDVDFTMLDMIAEYSAIVKAQIADAGSALSGAQIIGNLFTLDPRKFAAGIARLTTQNRIANLLVSQDMIDMALGQGRKMTRMEKLKNMFFGKNAIGNLIFMEAYRDDEMSTSEQTDDMLSTQSVPNANLQSIMGIKP